MKKITTSSLLAKKQAGEKITALTAYDASFAKLFDSKGVDIILIGDSLGMVLKGEPDTLAVTVEEIAYHTRAVASGVTSTFVIADMPRNDAILHNSAAPVWPPGDNLELDTIILTVHPASEIDKAGRHPAPPML